MKYKVIKTDKGYVAVSSEPIKKGDIGFIVNGLDNTIEEIVEVKIDSHHGLVIEFKDGLFAYPHICHLIIATEENISLKGVPQFKLPVGEDSDYYAWEQAQIIFEREQGRKPNLNDNKDLLIVSCLEIGYKAGMKNRKYSDDDLNKAIEYGQEEMLPFEKGKYKKFLESLSKDKLVTEVVFETTFEAIRNEGEDVNGDEAFRYVPKLKVIDWIRYPSGLLTVKEIIYDK